VGPVGQQICCGGIAEDVSLSLALLKLGVVERWLGTLLGCVLDCMLASMLVGMLVSLFDFSDVFLAEMFILVPWKKEVACGRKKSFYATHPRDIRGNHVRVETINSRHRAIDTSITADNRLKSWPGHAKSHGRGRWPR